MRRLGVGVVLAVTIAGSMLACGAARLPAPSYAQQPTAALGRVAFPPPPARVEFIPAVPNDRAVWIDGEWTWQGRRWAWKPGRWVDPPSDATYSPWATARDQLGELYFAEGKWRDDAGKDLPDPTPLAVARTRGGAVTSPVGEAISTAPNVAADAPASKPGEPGAEEGGAPETPSGATLTGTVPKSGTAVDSGPPPVDASMPDVSLADVVTHDAEPLHGASSATEAPSVAPSPVSSPRMSAQ